MGESISLPFLASRGHLHSLAHDPFLHLQGQQHTISKSLCVTSGSIITSPFSDSDTPTPPHKDPYDYTRIT